MMHQLQIEYFFPLTQQIPLDLDYADCERPKLTVSSATTGLTLLPVTTSTTWIGMEISPTKLTVDVENITFKQKVKPNWFRRIVYKTIGVQWEIK
jgi:hypothetical protein